MYNPRTVKFKIKQKSSHGTVDNDMKPYTKV